MKLRNLMIASASLTFIQPPVCAQRPELVVQTGHSEAVMSVAFSPDGKLLASAGADGTVRLWEVESGAELRLFSGHTDAVVSVAFRPGGRELASGGRDGTIRFWDVASGRELKVLKARYVLSIAFSPDGQKLVIATLSEVLLWDITSGTVLRRFEVRNSYVKSLALSRDGKTLAVGCDRPSLPVGDRSDDGTIKLWDVARGVEVLTLRGHSGGIASLAFSPDGTALASIGSDVRLWEVSSGRVRWTVGKTSDSMGVAISDDGKFVASAGFDGIKVWDAQGNELHTLRGHNKAVACIAFRPGMQTIASGSYDQTVKLWDANTATGARTLKGNMGPVYDVAFSPDGKLLAGGQGFVGKLWDLKGGIGSHTYTGLSGMVESVAISPDGRTLTTAGDHLMLWDTATGIEQRRLTAAKSYVKRVAFSPDGRLLASIDVLGLRVRNLASGTEAQVPFTTGSYVDVGFSVDVMAFSPDSKLLVTGNKDGSISIRDALTLKYQRHIDGGLGGVASVAFSPDGKTIASGTMSGSFFPGVYLSDVEDGKQIRSLKGHTRTVTSIAFSPDGRTLASASEDATVRLWEVATGRELLTLKAGSVAVNVVAFSPDGKLLASGGEEARIRLWDAVAGAELASLMALNDQDWIVATPDGLFDGSPGAWKRVLWQFNNNTFDKSPIEVFFNEFYHPGLLAELFAGARPRATESIADKDRRQPRLTLGVPGGQSAPGGMSHERTVSLRIEVAETPPGERVARGSGAQDVRLFRNGSLVRAWRGDVLGGRDAATLEATVPVVAGENLFTAYAFNRDNVKSSDATLVVKGAEALRRKGTAYVMAVGVNDYANPQYNLKYAVADAEAFGAEVKRQQEGLGQFEKVEVISLVNRQATKRAILDGLAELAGRVRPEDAVIIYFAGHGTAQGDRFYLIPHDLGYAGDREKVDAGGLREIVEHSISDEELEAAVEKMDAGKLLMVIDACNSGQALEAEEKRRGPMNSKGLAQLAYEKGMYILAAAQSYQAAQEAARLGHGFLTFALVEEGMKKGAADQEPRDGAVLIREWMDFAVEQVPKMQTEEMVEALRSRGVKLVFVAGEEKIEEPEKRSVQRPRVFYRREADAQPLVIAKPRTTSPVNR